MVDEYKLTREEVEREKRIDNLLLKQKPQRPEPKGTAIDGPAHYKGYDVLETINRYDLGFELGNVIKYILRAENKGKYLSDLKKAQFYLNWFVNKCEGESDGKV